MKVLLVSGDVGLRLSLGMALLKAGYALLEALDCGHAWELLEREGAGLCVCDAELPGAPGLDLLARLRADPRFGRIPAILLAGEATTEERLRRYYSAGAIYCIEKPVDIQTFLLCVKALALKS